MSLGRRGAVLTSFRFPRVSGLPDIAICRFTPASCCSISSTRPFTWSPNSAWTIARKAVRISSLCHRWRPNALHDLRLRVSLRDVDASAGDFADPSSPSRCTSGTDGRCRAHPHDQLLEEDDIPARNAPSQDVIQATDAGPDQIVFSHCRPLRSGPHPAFASGVLSDWLRTTSGQGRVVACGWPAARRPTGPSVCVEARSKSSSLTARRPARVDASFSSDGTQ
jgi:hypothetical protein